MSSIRTLIKYKRKTESDHTSNNKVKLFRENIVVIEEEWFSDMNLTDDLTFLKVLIKHAKYIINQKIPCDTQQNIHKIAMNNIWNTPIVQILREKCDAKFLFKVSLLSRIANSIELLHEWVLTHFKYHETEFYSRLFDDQKKDPTKSFQYVQIKRKIQYLMLLSCMFYR